MSKPDRITVHPSRRADAERQFPEAVIVEDAAFKNPAIAILRNADGSEAVELGCRGEAKP